MAKSRREQQLEYIILEIYWMARRYADGRQTYAVSMCNDALDLAAKLDIPIKKDPATKRYYAQDGSPYIKPREEPIDEETSVAEAPGSQRAEDSYNSEPEGC